MRVGNAESNYGREIVLFDTKMSQNNLSAMQHIENLHNFLGTDYPRHYKILDAANHAPLVPPFSAYRFDDDPHLRDLAALLAPTPEPVFNDLLSVPTQQPFDYFLQPPLEGEKILHLYDERCTVEMRLPLFSNF